jgi:hypothetical protein
MKLNRLIFFYLSIPLLLVYIDAGKAAGYSGNVHMELTKKTYSLFRAAYPDIHVTTDEEASSWKGSYNEDAGALIKINDIGIGSRYFNHFYDPTNGNGLTHELYCAPYALVLGIYPVDSITWALSPEVQSNSKHTVEGENKADYSWPTALQKAKEGDWLYAYAVVGHILHLLQDLTVPAHTRNEPHPLGDLYEKWVKKNFQNNQIWENIISQLRKEDIPTLYLLHNYFHNIAEYTNRYFLTLGTINSYPRPELREEMRKKKTVIDERGKEKRVWYYIGLDEEGKEYKIAAWRLLDYILDFRNIAIPLSSKGAYLDEECHKDYFSRLAKKAILYGAGVIKLFNDSIVLIGTISGSVKDAVTRSPLQGASIDVYSGSSIISSGATDSNGVYSFSVPAGSGYTVKFSKTGYIPAIYENVSVEANTTTYLETVLQIDTTYSGTGNVSGKIVNALDGSGVSGLTIKLREGINVTSGSIIATTTTGSGGFYEFTNLNAGYYTAEVSGSGYNTTYFTVICIGGLTTPDQDATITPTLSLGETRIILTWGETPSDLDSHLTGPLPDGTRFHMYWWHAELCESGCSGAGSPWPEYVKLDKDDTSSYGPETTTIYQQIGGLYRFSVHDYTNRWYSYSYDLSNSGAQVRVYRGSNLVETFNVPSNQEGTLWTVFELSGDTITPINTMSYESYSSDIQSVSLRRSITTDAELIRNLPSKR